MEEKKKSWFVSKIDFPDNWLKTHWIFTEFTAIKRFDDNSVGPLFVSD